MAAGMLWVLDASINISMEPFRAFVADQLPTAAARGYAMQSFFIGVVRWSASSCLRGVAHGGVSKWASRQRVADTVRYAFYCGAAVCSWRCCGRC
jgi:maltose/moltooligosaccharide transporter